MRVKQNDANWRETYTLFMRSVEWRTKRDLVLRRDNYLCQVCLIRRAYTAHHRLYPQPCTFAMLVHQPCYQLSSICDVCHPMFDGVVFVGPKK